MKSLSEITNRLNQAIQTNSTFLTQTTREIELIKEDSEWNSSGILEKVGLAYSRFIKKTQTHVNQVFSKFCEDSQMPITISAIALTCFAAGYAIGSR